MHTQPGAIDFLPPPGQSTVVDLCRIDTQLLGAAAIAAWAFVTSFIVFKLIDLTVGMRVSPEEEREGLDRSEHGAEAYPEFVFQEQVADPKDLDPVGSNGS